MFRSKFPSFQGRRIVIIPLFGILGMCVGLIIQLSFDLAIRRLSAPLFTAFEPLFSPVGTILTMVIAFYFVSGIWRNKDKALEKDYKTAYQWVILPGFFGINMMVSIIIHNLLPIIYWEPAPSNQLTYLLGSSFLAYNLELGPLAPVEFWVRHVLGLLIIVYGLLCVYRVLTVFGLDYMGLVYTFYPEESVLKDQKIYSILRHPAYTCFMIVLVGSFVVRLSIYSLLVVLFVWLFFHFHLKYYEEKELLQRFGSSYEEYMITTPALFPRFADLPTHVKFTLGILDRKQG